MMILIRQFRKEWRILLNILYSAPLNQEFEWLKIIVQHNPKPHKINSQLEIRLEIDIFFENIRNILL